MKKLYFAALVLALALNSGCIGNGSARTDAGDPLPNPNPGPSPTPSPNTAFEIACGDSLNQADQDDGSRAACIPPPPTGTFAYFKLGATLTQVTPTDPSDSDEWDFAVRGSAVMTNGGENGTGGVEIAFLPGEDFFALTQAPTGPYHTDLASTSGGFFEGLGEYAFMTYPLPEADENPTTGPLYFGMWRYTLFLVPQHTISARDVVYVLHATDGEYYKITFISDYRDLSDAAAPDQLGWLAFAWDTVSAP